LGLRPKANKKKGSNTETIKVQGEAPSVDINTAYVFPRTLANSEDRCCSNQVLMWMRLGIFWKKMPSRSFYFIHKCRKSDLFHTIYHCDKHSTSHRKVCVTQINVNQGVLWMVGYKCQ
jgi:hypothetical protein